jgi:hypothetical protein
MVQMIRKQVYIQRQQEAALKRLSKSRGLSEAELIRQAIDRQAGSVAAPFVSDADAWEEAHTFMLALRDRTAVTDQPRNWRREDLYEDRVGRYGSHPD